MPDYFFRRLLIAALLALAPSTLVVATADTAHAGQRCGFCWEPPGRG